MICIINYDFLVALEQKSGGRGQQGPAGTARVQPSLNLLIMFLFVVIWC